MKARIAILLVALLVTGCASINESMRKWQGHHISEVMASWGPPSAVVDDGLGGKIYTWGSTRHWSTPGSAQTHVYGNMAYTTYQPAQSQSYNATRSFFVNKNGIIYRWHWRGL